MKNSYLVLKPDQYKPALNVLGTRITVLTQSYGVTLQQGCRRNRAGRAQP